MFDRQEIHRGNAEEAHDKAVLRLLLDCLGHVELQEIAVLLHRNPIGQ
jgi:hypothetical protein